MSRVCTTMSEDDVKIETTGTDQNVGTVIGEIIDTERNNSYRKLTHITAYVMRFAANCRVTKNERKKDLLCINAIENAKYIWITYRYTQGNIFRDEINCIDNHDNSTKRITLVQQLKVFLYEQKLL